MITKFGKRFLTNYLAGNVGFAEKNIALGIGSSAESDLDSRLNFEFFKFPIQFGSIDIETNGTESPITARDGETTIAPGDTLYSVVYKAVIPQDVSGIISEIGIYPSSGLSANRFSGKMIALFEDVSSWNLVGGSGNPELTASAEGKQARVGNTTAKISNNGLSTSIEYLTYIPATDFSGYSKNDSITFSYITEDTNLIKINVKLYTLDPNDYYLLEFSSASGTIEDGGTWLTIGNKIHSVLLSELQSYGSPDIANINAIGIEVVCSSEGSPSTVYLDALRINDEDTFDPINGMISRSVLASPITKSAGQQLDLEYRLGLNF